MKRILCILLLFCILFCGCSAKFEYPSSEEVRSLIPEIAEIDLSVHLPVIEEARTLDSYLAGIPRTFSLDEAVWEEDFESGDMQFYRRIADPDCGDYICIYDDGDVSVDCEAYDLYYNDGSLSSAYLPDADIYLGADEWTVSFSKYGYHYYLCYSEENVLTYANVSTEDDAGFTFTYIDGAVISSNYSVTHHLDDYTEHFNAYYDSDGKLENIYYDAYDNSDSLFSKNHETVYNSDFLSEDAPASTAAPASAEDPTSVTLPEPTETEPPKATEEPEPTPKRTGFFGKVLDEIEKDFNNIKEDIVADFQ